MALLQAQRQTTPTAVCHVRRACTPPCSTSVCMRVSPSAATAVVYRCCTFSAAVAGAAAVTLLVAAAVTLLAAAGSLSMLLLPPSSPLQLLQALVIVCFRH